MIFSREENASARLLQRPTLPQRLSHCRGQAQPSQTTLRCHLLHTGTLFPRLGSQIRLSEFRLPPQSRRIG